MSDDFEAKYSYAGANDHESPVKYAQHKAVLDERDRLRDELSKAKAEAQWWEDLYNDDRELCICGKPLDADNNCSYCNHAMTLEALGAMSRERDGLRDELATAREQSTEERQKDGTYIQELEKNADHLSDQLTAISADLAAAKEQAEKRGEYVASTNEVLCSWLTPEHIEKPLHDNVVILGNQMEALRSELAALRAERERDIEAYFLAGFDACCEIPDVYDTIDGMAKTAFDNFRASRKPSTETTHQQLSDHVLIEVDPEAGNSKFEKLSKRMLALAGRKEWPDYAGSFSEMVAQVIMDKHDADIEVAIRFCFTHIWDDDGSVYYRTKPIDIISAYYSQRQRPAPAPDIPRTVLVASVNAGQTDATGGGLTGDE